MNYFLNIQKSINNNLFEKDKEKGKEKEKELNCKEFTSRISECEKAQAHVLALRACTEGQIKILQKELIEKNNNLLGESSDSDYDLKKRKECSLLSVEELKNKLNIEMTAKEALFSLNFVLLSDIRKCKLFISELHASTSDNKLSKTETEKNVRTKIKEMEREKEKEKEKEREAYNVKLKNVPGIGKEDSPGSELGGKSIREEVRRASFGPGTFFDSKNIPHKAIESKKIPMDMEVKNFSSNSVASQLIRRASMGGGWHAKNNETNMDEKGREREKEKEKEKGREEGEIGTIEKVVGTGTKFGKCFDKEDSIKERIKEMKNNVRRNSFNTVGENINTKTNKIPLAYFPLPTTSFVPSSPSTASSLHSTSFSLPSTSSTTPKQNNNDNNNNNNKNNDNNDNNNNNNSNNNDNNNNNNNDDNDDDNNNNDNNNNNNISNN